MGTIVKAGGVRLLEVSKQYECQNSKCRFRFTVSVDLEQDNTLPQPRQCPSSSMRSGSNCKSTNLREVEGSRRCVDYQEIKLQDHIDRLEVGRVPRSITVLLKGDLVDKFSPGDAVMVVGEVIKQWRPLYKGVRCQLDIMIDANSIVAGRDSSAIGHPDLLLSSSSSNSSRRKDSDAIFAATRRKFDFFWKNFLPEEGEKNMSEVDKISQILVGRNIIVNSVCPHLCGMFFVKLSLLLTLIGGTHPDPSGDEGGGAGKAVVRVRRRHQSHLLIVGDPGCGKSQLLRFAADVSPRSILTTGVGTTGAGLTCTAVREGSDWTLEAGALVLANDGVCCIDEFASMREQDRATIHEAMEQQTLSVAKAGLVVKLNTRTTVIACCNPKGQFDPMSDLTSNTAIASPLLSRFDIIIVLQDRPNKDWDKKVSTFLLRQAVGGQADRANNTTSETNSNNIKTWSLEKLREYISFVKHQVQPTLSAEAKCLLLRYYQLQRQSDDRQSARTTVRLLESLVRLSEAHAKLLMREEVGIEDAITAISCVSLSQMSACPSLLGAQNEGIEEEGGGYLRQEEAVLDRLRLTRRSLRALCRQDERDFAVAINEAAASAAASASAANESVVPSAEDQDGPGSITRAVRQDDKDGDDYSERQEEGKGEEDEDEGDVPLSPKGLAREIRSGKEAEWRRNARTGFFDDVDEEEPILRPQSSSKSFSLSHASSSSSSSSSSSNAAVAVRPVVSRETAAASLSEAGDWGPVEEAQPLLTVPIPGTGKRSLSPLAGSFGSLKGPQSDGSLQLPAMAGPPVSSSTVRSLTHMYQSQPEKKSRMSIGSNLKLSDDLFDDW